MYDPYADFKKFVLPNGLTVYHQYWDRPWVKFSVKIHTGAREDSPGQRGLAHFVEHCVSKNIEGYTYEEAQQFFEKRGKHLGFGATNYLWTEYEFMVPVQQESVQEALLIFGRMLITAKLEKNIERERSVIKQEYHRNNPIPEKSEWIRKTRQILFTGHKLENYIGPLGHPDEFAAIDQASLQGFYDKYYTPANMSVVVVGGMNADLVEKLLSESLLGTDKPGSRNQIPNKPWSIIRPEQNLLIKSLSEIQSSAPDQTEYTTGWTLPAEFSPEALHLTSAVLRQLLKDEIRAKLGATYTVSVGHGTWQDVFGYAISTEIDPKLGTMIDDMVRDCIGRLSTERELFEHKKQQEVLSYGFMDFWPEKICGTASGDLGRYQQIRTLSEELEATKAVTHEEIVRVSQHLSAEQQCTLMITP